MKRFFKEIKFEDLIYYKEDQINLNDFMSSFHLPEPLQDGDQYRINIIVNEKINKEIGEISQKLFKALINNKAIDQGKEFQESVKNRFIFIYKNKPEWLSILALHYLILFREHLYRLNIQAQKSKAKLSPFQRKALRFHAGYIIAKLFESIFHYQLPYYIKDYDFSDFIILFNPILLSGSFPEYFISDYFCYLEIKNPLWSPELFYGYKENLLASSEYGLSSLIGMSLTTKGASLQKTYRLIKHKFSEFNEKTSKDVIDKIIDDPAFLEDLVKNNTARKLFLHGDLPRKMSKQDFFTKLVEDYKILTGKMPFSSFLKLAADAEILRKLINYIVLIDPREYPTGYDELMGEYTLYLVTPPFVEKNTGKVPEKITNIKQNQVQQLNEKLQGKTFDLDETVHLHMNNLSNENNEKEGFNIKASHHKTADLSNMQIKENKEGVNKVINELEQFDIPDLDQESEPKKSNNAPSIKEIEEMIDETKNSVDHKGIITEDSDENVEKKSDNIVTDILDSIIEKPPAKSTDNDVAIVTSAPQPLIRKKPYLLGTLFIPQKGELFLMEKPEGENYTLFSVSGKNAHYKISFDGEKARFFVNKKSNWHKPSKLIRNIEENWEAKIIRKSDSKVFSFYLDNAEKALRKSPPPPITPEPLEIPEELQMDKSVEVKTASDNKLDEYEGKSVGELSQALLDGIINIDEYNALIGGESSAQSSGKTMEDPDVVLEKGVNYCSDWQGRILSSHKEEADLCIIISQNSFKMELKRGNQWVTLFNNQNIPQEGFKSSFHKEILYKDLLNNGVEKKIDKEYPFHIAPLIGDKYGIKFY